MESPSPVPESGKSAAESLRVILAGGGTGGHVIPALAIAAELRDRYHAQILFVGTSAGVETKMAPAAGFDLRLIEVGKLKNVSLATRLKTLSALPRAVFYCVQLLREYRPAVVIGVGGYASGPAMMAAILSRTPVLAFEANRVPGLANRLVARLVSAAAVQFPETAATFPHAQVTGVPVRREFWEVRPRPPLGEAGALPTVLVFGGSLGASAVNQAFLGAAPVLTSEIPGLQIIHQTGTRDYQSTVVEYAKLGIQAEVSAFIDPLSAAFERADLLICRSGASTVAEVAAAGKPAIFIPFPRAADDHQRRNAEAFVQQSAAQMIVSSDLTPAHLASMAADLLHDPGRLAAMSAAARKMAHPGAGEVIAGMAARLASKKTSSSVA